MSSNVWIPMILALGFSNFNYDDNYLNYLNKYEKYEKYGDDK